jgi:hypothetical protein
VPRYLLTNVRTNERYEVEAWCAEAACQRLHWSPDECAFVVLRDGWSTNAAEPPQRLWSV